MAKASNSVWLCPKCGSHNVGKVSWTNYFCMNCDIEFDPETETIYTIQWDGTLVAENEFSNIV